MNKKLLFLITGLLFLLPITNAFAAVDDNAAVVKLRASCAENNAALDNCFTSFSGLSAWMGQTRKPNATTPLHVDIGPGTFTGAPDINISCNASSGYTGHTSFNGSGSENTVLIGAGSGSTAAVNVENCTDLHFSDLKITTSFYGGIYWIGGGNSRWNNVEVIGAARAWAEQSCGAVRGEHYWFSSKVKANGFFLAEPYSASCDETWFFGSEVKGVVSEEHNASGTVIRATGKGIIHLYGSNLVALVDVAPPAGSSATSALPAATASSGGQIHIHGTGIDVISTTGQNVVALEAASGGMIHADVSAYNLKTSGSVTRISNLGGSVKAPYRWAQDNQPPSVISDNGADMAVETNCDDTSCHDQDTGPETHLLIYNDNCQVGNHGPWFDVVTGRCRGDMGIN
jgi:hypothetical protein